jgi:hypothetical protein
MYSPKIDEELIPELYSMGKHFHKPMTFIVNTVLRFAVMHFNNNGSLIGCNTLESESLNATICKLEKRANNK